MNKFNIQNQIMGNVCCKSSKDEHLLNNSTNKPYNVASEPDTDPAPYYTLFDPAIIPQAPHKLACSPPSDPPQFYNPPPQYSPPRSQTMTNHSKEKPNNSEEKVGSCTSCIEKPKETKEEIKETKEIKNIEIYSDHTKNNEYNSDEKDKELVPDHIKNNVISYFEEKCSELKMYVSQPLDQKTKSFFQQLLEIIIEFKTLLHDLLKQNKISTFVCISIAFMCENVKKIYLRIDSLMLNILPCLILIPDPTLNFTSYLDKNPEKSDEVIDKFTNEETFPIPNNIDECKKFIKNNCMNAYKFNLTIAKLYYRIKCFKYLNEYIRFVESKPTTTLLHEYEQNMQLYKDLLSLFK